MITPEYTRIRCGQPDLFWPEWKRTALLMDDGSLYVPYWISGYPEERAVYACGWSGASFLMHDEHVFVDLAWLKEEHPKDRSFYDQFEAIIRRRIAEDGIGVRPTAK